MQIFNKTTIKQGFYMEFYLLANANQYGSKFMQLCLLASGGVMITLG